MSGEILRAALSHAARGWRVFPLRVGDKRPAIRNWEFRATTDPARIWRAWAHAPFGIGIACGPSGLVVIDLDVPKPDTVRPPEWDHTGVHDGADVLAALAEQHDAEVPLDTYAVQTASGGGEHLYFTAPDERPIRNSAGRLGWLIDVRGAGGYVVAAGSVVRSRRYRSNGHDVIAPLPVWIAELLHDPVTTTPRPDMGALLDAVERRSQYVAAALRGEVDKVLATPAGSHQRNNTLNKAAFALGQLVGAGLIPDGLARAALAEASAVIGLPPREPDRTIRSGLTAGARSPRTPSIGRGSS